MSNLTSEKNKGNGGGGPVGNIGGGMDSSGRNKFIGKDDLDNSSWRQPQHHQHQSYDYMNYYNAPAASQQQFYGVPETWSNGGGGNVGPGNDQYYESFSPGPGFNFNQYYSGDYNTWGQPGPGGPPGQRKGYEEYYSDYSTASLEKEFKDFDLQSKSSSKSWASIASQPAKPTMKKKIIGGVLPPPSLGWEKNGKVQAPVQAPHWVGGGSRPVPMQQPTPPVLPPPQQPPPQQQQQQQMNHGHALGQGLGPQSQSELQQRNGPVHGHHGGGHGHGHGQQQFHQPPPQQQQQQQRYAPFNSTNSAPPLIPHDSLNLKQQRNREEVAAPPQVVQQQQVVAATPQYPDDSKIKSEYNPTHFDLSCEEARFFVIKSYSEDDIHRSIKYEIWCSTEHGNKRLDTAFRERAGRGPIYLFFSVNSSGHFCGMAQMMSAIDYESSASVWSQDKWKGQFKVKWIYVKDVPNNALRQIKLENNENKSVTNSRDTQEVPLEKGKQVLRIIHTFHHTTSIFDDFIHYEKRQEEELRRTVPPVQQQGPQQGNHHGGSGSGRGGYFGDRDRDRDRDRNRDGDRGGRGRDDHHHGPGSHQQRGPPMHGQGQGHGGHRGGDRGPPSLMSRGGRQLPPRI